MAASSDPEARSRLKHDKTWNLRAGVAPDSKPKPSRPTAAPNSGNPSSSTYQAIHRLDAGGSVQALVVDDEVLIAGLQGGQIAAWSIKTYELLARVDAHEQSVLGLHLSVDRKYLFSCGVDSVVNVWSPQSLELLFSLYSHFEIGDIFSLAYSVRLQTIFCGAQNASIQWHSFRTESVQSPILSATHVSRKHRFFDSIGPGGASPARAKGNAHVQGGHSPNHQSFYFHKSSYLPFAHKSYLYCMVVIPTFHNDIGELDYLATGAGDGTIKLWDLMSLGSSRLIQSHKFKIPDHNVLSLACSGIFLYAGLSDGIVYVFSLTSKQLVQKLIVPHGDVNTVRILGGVAFCGTSWGNVEKFDARFSAAGMWKAHEGKILASVIASGGTSSTYITAGNDHKVAFWKVSHPDSGEERPPAHDNDELMESLKEFVAYRSVSGNAQYARDCHQAAEFVRKLCSVFGAKSMLLPSPEGANPVLLAKFAASQEPDTKKNILFYGHYDVVDAEPGSSSNFENWIGDPFHLLPMNGFLYGRGVTDNKGPILATLYAVADLVHSKNLSCNITLLLEGEEEAGSRGFEQIVMQHRKTIGSVDYILLSNSYWLDDHIPCLTYGMRGVVHASITISSGKPDRHSGMEGKSRQHEPLKDLTVLLSTLTGSSGTEIMIPGFYDKIIAADEAESKRFISVATALAPGHPEIKEKGAFAESLMQRWREPNLTIHRMEVPESKTAATISRYATATLSIRVVPRQDAQDVARDLERYLQSQFAKLKTTNRLEISISSKANAWLGQPSNQIFQALEKAIMEVWHPTVDNVVYSSSHDFRSSSRSTADATASSFRRSPHRRASSLASKGTFTVENIPHKPLYIREGGSIPAISFLEREFQAPAAMYPMGQSSDNAHLSNERMRVENLYNGREILKKVFSRL